MKKFAVTLLIISMISALVSGCSSASKKIDDSGKDAKSDIKVALVLGLGGLGDKAFNDNGYAGVEKAKKELGIQFDYVEPKEISEFETDHREYAKTGEYDLIIGLGFDQADAIKKVASEFPNQKFLLIDGTVDAPNVTSVTFKDYEKAFLIGAFAAQETKTNKLGIVGGMDIPLINAFAAGYKAGAKYINKDVDVMINYVGAWNDPNTAKEMAISMYDKDADIVYAAAGASGLGVFSAAKEKDKYAIGADVNQNSIDPDHIILSSVRRLDNIIFDQIKSIKDGSFKSGTLNLGLKDNAVSYTADGSNIKMPQEYIDKVEELKKKVSDGEIKVPDKLEDVDSFLSSNK